MSIQTKVVMSKQEEIREDVARTFYEQSDIYSMIAWLNLPDEARDSFYYKADSLLHRLHSQGVVIKKEGELPHYPGDDAFDKLLKSDIYLNSQDDMLVVGYTLTEPLIEEE